MPANSTATGRSYQHDGQQVWLKLRGQVLQEMALAAGGAYIPAGTKLVDMSQSFTASTLPGRAARLRDGSHPGSPRFPGFQAVGSYWPCWNLCSSTTAASALPRSAATVRPQAAGDRRQAAAAVTALALGLGISPRSAKAAAPKTYDLRSGQPVHRVGRVREAAADYLEASASAPELQELIYNRLSLTKW